VTEHPRRRKSDSFLNRRAVVLTIIGVFAMFAVPTYVGGKLLGDVNDLSKDNRSSIRQIKAEREIRRTAQTEINRYVCRENNKQDRILASLLAISLKGSEERRGELTPDQLEALTVFQRALRALEHETPCNALAIAFTEASDTGDLRQIRRILYGKAILHVHTGR
jgi:hypothetical protein